MPTTDPREAQLQQLSHQIAYLDSTDPRVKLQNAAEIARLREAYAELAWRIDHPENTARFRCAFRGKPLSFQYGGGSSAFNTEEEAVAYLARLGWADDPEMSVVDCGELEPVREAA